MGLVVSVVSVTGVVIWSRKHNSRLKRSPRKANLEKQLLSSRVTSQKSLCTLSHDKCLSALPWTQYVITAHPW